MPRAPYLAIPALCLIAACSQQGADKPEAPPSTAGPKPTDTAAEPEEDTSNLVQVEVMLAGEDELAVHYTIKEGWHLYWINPGDAGLRTQAEFEGPEGVKFQPLRYPAPEAFKSPGDITSYGYEHETVLFSRFELPDPPPEASEVVVHAKWLACKESCVKGKADAKIELATAQMADDTLLIDHRQKLPRPGTELKAETKWSTGDQGPVLDVAVQEGKILEFYPLETEPAMLADTKLEAGRLVLRYSVGSDKIAQVAGPQGVVVLEDSTGARNYFHLEAAWPSS